MGASCGKFDCAASVEDCSYPAFDCKRPNGTLQDESEIISPESWDTINQRSSSRCPDVHPVAPRFAINHSRKGPPKRSWRKSYVLGRELGSGQTATVFEAFAVPQQLTDPSFGSKSTASTGSSSSPSSKGRRVALKCFHRNESAMFKHELKALNAVGVHPHIIRLLESFEDSNGEDVLILEHCDGGDIYELYAAHNGRPMAESFVRQVIKELLLALLHLFNCGVEHRDVKPENLLLYNLFANGQAVLHLKLADFGWAAVVDRTQRVEVPLQEGIGSLWYAPPELNPPVKGLDICIEELPMGKSDMWSVGIIAYLLLTGHSPFNSALKLKNPEAREHEVCRLAAQGEINTKAKAWMTLSEAARSFILALIRPNPAKRLSAIDAFHHPFIRHLTHDAQSRLSTSFSMIKDSSQRWACLDNLQRLCWLALARATTEQEFAMLNAVEDFVSIHAHGQSGFLEKFAAKMVSVASPTWFSNQAAWASLIHFAFLYLDVDADGLLSVDDIAKHFAGLSGEAAYAAAEAILKKWTKAINAATTAKGGLNISDFTTVLCSVTSDQSFWKEVPICKTEMVEPNLKIDAYLQERMGAIEKVCDQYLDEETETD